MSISGTIKLISHLGIVVVKKTYKGKEERNKIIEKWGKEHPGLFHAGAATQICPNANIHRVRVDGTNSQTKKLEEAHAAAQRPPAKYNNWRSSYGITDLP